jgi:hypothetical protein
LPMGGNNIVSAFSRLREAVQLRDVPSDSGHLFVSLIKQFLQ